MDESFDIPVVYKGEQLYFNARILAFGYTYKIQVDVNGIEVLFEPDEERNYRAMLASPDTDSKKADKGLIQAIAEAIANIR